ncbi:MAG: SMP-30/gluconolactonase/LRE family protein [Thalassovita sp.]
MIPKGWRKIGTNLDRPESVQVGPDGTLYTSHRGHGVCQIDPDGTQTLLAPMVEYGGTALLPNGIARLEDGGFLIANISDAGGIHHLKDGQIRPYLTALDGAPMPPVNFVTTDDTGRVWFSVSSRMRPRHLAYRRTVKGGFVGLIEKGQAQIVVDGLHYTNEVRPDLANGWLYVSETFSQKISRFAISPDLKVGPKETFAQFPKGAFVDGIALDGRGGLYVACIVSNEVFHVSATGQQTLIASDRNDAWVDEVEAALDAGTMNRSHFDRTPGGVLRNVSSVALRGQDTQELVCGALLADYLVVIPL